MVKKVLCILLCLVMMTAAMPAAVFAEEYLPVEEIQLLGFHAPQLGETAGDNLADMRKYENVMYTIDNLSWVKSNGTVLRDTDIFEPGCDYHLEADIHSSGIWRFTETTKLFLNGSTELLDEDWCRFGTEGYYWFSTVNISMPDNECIKKGQLLGYKRPAAGESVGEFLDALHIPDNAPYEFEIALTNDFTAYVPLEREDVFITGNYYSMEFVLRPKFGYAFTDASEVIVENVDEYSDVECSVDSWHNYAVIQIKFTVTADKTIRIAGDSREATAVKISEAMMDTRNNNGFAFIASGDNYADALAGSWLAGYVRGPMLLVRKNGIQQSVLDELKRFQATRKVFILGGTSAVSEETEKTLREAGYDVQRFAGNDRFETAVAIARGATPYRDLDSVTDIFFVYSHNYPDALSVSSAAGKMIAPILYLNSSGELDKATKDYLDSIGYPVNIYIIGGPAVISTAAEENLKPYARDGKVERIYGENRYDTCIAINRRFAEHFAGANLCVATGTNFPDALAGGPFCYNRNAPLVLVDNKLDPVKHKNTVDYLREYHAGNTYILGGTGAVSQEIEDFLAEAYK